MESFAPILCLTILDPSNNPGEGSPTVQPNDSYLALMGVAPKRVPHWEHISNPGFELYVTGVDPWEKPRTARLKLLERFKIDLGCGAPPDNTPIPKPDPNQSSFVDENGHHKVRWGAGLSGSWDWGRDFHSIEDVIAYQPLEHLDLTNGNIVENRDYSVDDETFYRSYAGPNPAAEPPKDRIASVSFYNTMFMWPLLTFGWELFLELAGAHQDELKRLLADFAVINRKVFRTFARLPVNMVVCHDAICTASGPVCSPRWMREHIYPYYEEWFSMLHDGGKKVIFMADGNIDKVADDVAACGADGFVSEPMTDWKALAKKYPDKLLAGEGDNRILSRGDPAEIRSMVRSMAETAKICAGYFMCIGNHIPWNVPPPAIELYFDLSAELARR